MTYAIGQNCEVILDGTGYFIKPGTYIVHQPRIRKATIRADGSQAYVDLGPGKRIWKFVIICLNDLTAYDQTPTGLTGQQYRDALRTSYATVNATINFTDPTGTVIAVHFDDYAEHIRDLHSQAIALATGGSLAASYECGITLLEA